MPISQPKPPSLTATAAVPTRRVHVESAAALALSAVLASLTACGGDHVEAYTPGATSEVPAFAASAGAQGVVVADAPLARPAGTPCTITLFDSVEFKDFTAKPFAFPGAAGCAGTPAKIVLEADFSVNAGRQYDRTASIAIGGVNLYFGTTQEPSRPSRQAGASSATSPNTPTRSSPQRPARRVWTTATT